MSNIIRLSIFYLVVLTFARGRLQLVVVVVAVVVVVSVGWIQPSTK